MGPHGRRRVGLADEDLKPKPYEALRHRDFRRMAASMLVSLVGTQMQNAAIDWHVWILTRSPLALGLVGLVRVVPIVVLSLVGGLVADRHDRRRVLLVTQSTMTVVALALGAVTLLGRDSVGLVYLLTAATSGAAAFDNPSRQSLIPRLVPEQDLPGALAINLSAFQLASIGGPALTGLLLAGAAGTGPEPSEHAHAAGLALVYFINAASFLGVLLTLVTLKTSGEVLRAEGAPEKPFASLKEGLRFVFTTPILVWTMTLDFFATFFAGSMSLLPIFADQILKAGPAGYGWLRAAPGIGALLGSVWNSVRGLPRRQGRVFLWAVAAYGATTIVFGLSRNFALTFAALALVGLSDTISTVVRQTVRQLVTPDALRGRMTGVNMIFFMGGPQLGELEAGFVASLFASAALGASVAVVSGGVGTLLVVAFIAARAKVVRAYDWSTIRSSA
ncbi:MAG TPA: MFS transporter [Thermoanaerobaculia bacterium]|nr:MFS transporter [Thermoanaerobaculia bacterium]